MRLRNMLPPRLKPRGFNWNVLEAWALCWVRSFLCGLFSYWAFPHPRSTMTDLIEYSDVMSKALSHICHDSQANTVNGIITIERRIVEATPSIAESMDGSASYNQLDLEEVETLLPELLIPSVIELSLDGVDVQLCLFGLHHICNACLRS